MLNILDTLVFRSKSTFSKMFTLMGVTLTSLLLSSLSSSAVTLTQITDSNETDTWQELDWFVVGRASAPGDWEVGILPSETSPPVEQLDWTWMSTEEVPWRLDWDNEDKVVSFTFGELEPIYYDSNTSLPRFDAFYLWTRATTSDGKVEPGTSIELIVDKVNEIGINPVAASAATAPDIGTVITTNYFMSDTDIESLEGIAKMTWTSLNPQENSARSRVSFKIEGFDPPVDTIAQAVPESHSVVGLVVATGVALSLMRQGHKSR